MITSQEFDLALKIIADYKSQLEIILNKTPTISEKIDLQKNINLNILFILQLYYWDELNIHLEISDFKAIDIKLLKSIDFKKIHRYRGFGKIAESKFRKILESYPNY